MVSEIGSSRISAQQSQQVKMDQKPHAKIHNDSLVSASDSCLGGALEMAFGTVKFVMNKVISFFSTIFFCFDFSKKVDEAAVQKETLTNLKNELDQVADFFKRTKLKDTTSEKKELKSLWSEKYDQLTVQLKKIFMMDHFREWALAKEPNIEENDMIDYAETMYKNNNMRKKALEFTKDLTPVALNKQTWDPLVVMQSRFQRLSKELASKIDGEDLGFIEACIS